MKRFLSASFLVFFRQIDTLNSMLYFQQKIRQFVKLGIGGAAGFSLIAFYRGEPQFYSNVRKCTK